jgi:hypothetical protein
MYFDENRRKWDFVIVSYNMEKNLRNESTTQIITYFVQNINRKKPKEL